jgi:tape measure domain-containing protein
MNLETLVLELVADDSKLSQDIDRAVKSATQKLQALENGKGLSPNVNLKSLHELNKVLDSKQRHIKQTAAVFRANVIRPDVDLSEVDRLNTALNKTQKTSETTAKKVRSQTVKPTTDENPLKNLQRQYSQTQSAHTKTKLNLNNQTLSTSVNLGSLLGLEKKYSDVIDRHFKTSATLNSKGLKVNANVDDVEKMMKAFADLAATEFEANVKVNASGESKVKKERSAGGDVKSAIMVELLSQLLTTTREELKEMRKKPGIMSALTYIPRTVGKATLEGYGYAYSGMMFNNAVDAFDETTGLGVKKKAGRFVGEFAGRHTKRGMDTYSAYSQTETMGNAPTEFAKATQKAGESVDDLKVKISDAFAEPTTDNVNNAATQLLATLEAIASVPTTPIESLVKATKELKTGDIIKKVNEESKKYTSTVTNAGVANAQRVIVVSGGFAGTKGKSSHDVAEQIRANAKPGDIVIPVENINTDTTVKSGENPARWMYDAISIPATTGASGMNADAVSMAAVAKAAKDINPNVQIRFAGYSGGGFNADEATRYANAMGMKNVSGVAFATPGLMGKNAASNFEGYMGDNDPVRTYIEQVGRGMGIARPNDVIPGISGHALEDYINNAEALSLIIGEVIDTYGQFVTLANAGQQINAPFDLEDIQAKVAGLNALQKQIQSVMEVAADVNLANKSSGKNSQPKLLPPTNGQTKPVNPIKEVQANELALKKQVGAKINNSNLLPAAGETSGKVIEAGGKTKEQLMAAEIASQKNIQALIRSQLNDILSIALSVNNAAEQVDNTLGAVIDIPAQRVKELVPAVPTPQMDVQRKALRLDGLNQMPKTNNPVAENYAKNIANNIAGINRNLDVNAQEEVDKALEYIALIRKKTKDFFAVIAATMKDGNTGLAKAQAQTVIDVKQYAVKNINDIIAYLNSLGVDTGVGSGDGVGGALQGVKGNFTAWEKKAKKIIKQADKAELIAPSLENQVPITPEPYVLSQKEVTSILADLYRAKGTYGSFTGDKKGALKSYHAISPIIKEMKGVDLTSVGEDTIEGWKQGLLNEEGELDSTIAVIAQALPDRVKQILGIASPSKVFMQIGKNIVQGLTNGIESLKQSFSGTLDDVIDPNSAQEKGRELAEKIAYGVSGAVSLTAEAMESLIQEIQAQMEKMQSSGADIVHESIADKILEFVENKIDDTIDVTDAVTEIMQRINSESEDAAPSLMDDAIGDVQSRVTDGLSNGSTTASLAINDLQASLGALGGEIKSFIDQNPMLKLVFDTLSEIPAIGVGIASVIGLKAMADGLSSVASNALNAYKSLEGVNTAARMIPNGAKYIGQLRDQVLKLGTDLQSTLQEGVSFSAALVGTPLESQAQSMFMDASAALSYMQLPQQQYESALLALKQVASKGRVSLEEITGQLGEAVPGIMPMVADALNTTVEGAIQQIESGNVMAEELLPKLIQSMKERTEGMAPAAEKSLTAAMGRFQSTGTMVNAGIGEILAPNVIPLINTASSALLILAENVDKVVWGVQSLGIGLTALALATLAPKMIAWANATIFTATTMRTLASTIKSVMSVAIKPLLVMLAAVAAFEVISFTFNAKGSKEAEESLERINRQLARFDKTQIDVADLLPSVESQSGFLNFLDKVGRWTPGGLLGLPQAINKDWTFGAVEFSKELKTTDKIVKGLQSTLQYSAKLDDPIGLQSFVSMLDEVDNKILVTQGRMSALRIADAEGNTEQIKALAEEVKRLQEERKKIEAEFLPGGQKFNEKTKQWELIPGGIQVTKESVDAAIAQRNKFEAALANLDENKAPEQAKQLKADIDRLNEGITIGERRLKAYDDAMAQLGNTITAQRRAFIELQSAIAQTDFNFDVGITQQKANLITGQIERGLQDQVNEFENLNFALFEQQQNLEMLNSKLQMNTDYLQSPNIDQGQRELVEQLIGKPLTDATIADVTQLRLQLQSENNLKQDLGEQIVGVIESIVNIKGDIAKSGLSIAEAKKALVQFERTQEDYFRDTARQIFDLQIQIEDQQIQDSRSIRDLQFQVEDASLALRRSNRALAESYRDMMLDFDVQVATAQKAVEDARGELELNQMRAANLAITPGNSSSAARQVSDIVLRFAEGIFSTRTNERQIKIDILNLEKERIGRLIQIRDYEERQAEALRDYNRQIISLTDAFRDLERNMAKSAMSLIRSFDDITRAIQRTDATSPAGLELLGRVMGLKNSYSVPQLSGMGGMLPPPPPDGYGILPGGIVNQDYQRRLAQPNFSYADPWNPTPAEAARFGGNQSYQPSLDAGSVIRRQAGDLGILQDAMNNNMGGRSLTAPAQPQYQPMQNQGYRSMNSFNYQSMSSPQIAGDIVAKAGRASLTASNAKALIATANRIGIDPITLLTIMLFETAGTLSPSITNSIGATGLIQFTPGTAKGLGTSTTALRQMTFAQQLPWVEKYFKSRGFTPGMSDVEAYATVIGGNPRAQTAKDSNGVNAINGLQKMNASHRGNAIRLFNQLMNGNLQSKLNFGIPESIELGQTAQASRWFTPEGNLTINSIKKGFTEVGNDLGNMFYDVFRQPGITPPRELNNSAVEQINQNLKNIANPAPARSSTSSTPTQSRATTTSKPLPQAEEQYTKPQAMKFTSTGNQPFSGTGSSDTSKFIPIINQQMGLPNVGSLGNPNIGPGPTMQDTSPLYSRANEITELQQLVNLLKQQNNEYQNLINYRQAMDSIKGLEYQISEQLVQSSRSLVDQLVSIEQMRRSAKGYLTITEQAQDAGQAVYAQFQGVIRSIQDSNTSISRLIAGEQERLIGYAKAIAEIESLGQDSTEARQSFAVTEQKIKQLELGQQILNRKEQELKVTQRIAAQNAQQLKDQELALSLMDAYISKAGEVAQAQFKMGGSLVDVTPIRQAQFALMTYEARTKQQARQLGIENSEQEEWLLNQNKLLAELNLEASYADAIPYIKEFGNLLKEAVFETGNFGEALSKIFKVMATDIFDRLVLAPMQNWLGKMVANTFNLANPEALPDITQGGNSTLLTDQVINGVGAVAGRESPLQPLPGMEAVPTALNAVTESAMAVADQGFNPLTANLAQNVAQTVVNATTEQTALMTFIGALNAATMALIQFTAGMGMNTATTAAGGLFSTFTGGGGGLFSALAGGFTGNTVALPAFANGVDEVMAKERRMSGKQPYLAVLHQGEAVLSTLNGDAQRYRALKASGVWSQVPNFANGTDGLYQKSRAYTGNWSRLSNAGGAMDAPLTTTTNQRQSVAYKPTFNIQTPDANSFRRSQRQIEDDANSQFRRRNR